MAPVLDVTSIAVEGYSLSAGNSDMHGVRCNMRVGARTISPRAVEKVDVESNRQPACIEVFEFDPAGEDNVNIVIMDDGGAGGVEGAVGTATFSLASARQAGHDRLQVPVFSADTASRMQLGTLSLSVHWAPPESVSSSGNENAAAAVGSTSAETRPEAGVLDHHPNTSSRTPRETKPQLTDRPTGPVEAAASASGAPAPSAAVMAAMVAVAAMVAAASELPAPSSEPQHYSPTKGGKGPQGLLSGAAAPAVAFYPPIQPYDAAPPLEFGPGQLPMSSSGSTAFYPDIALRLRCRDIPSRLHKLRPTLSAPSA